MRIINIGGLSINYVIVITVGLALWASCVNAITCSVEYAFCWLESKSYMNTITRHIFSIIFYPNRELYIMKIAIKKSPLLSYYIIQYNVFIPIILINIYRIYDNWEVINFILENSYILHIVLNNWVLMFNPFDNDTSNFVGSSNSGQAPNPGPPNPGNPLPGSAQTAAAGYEDNATGSTRERRQYPRYTEQRHGNVINLATFEGVPSGLMESQASNSNLYRNTLPSAMPNAQLRSTGLDHPIQNSSSLANSRRVVPSLPFVSNLPSSNNLPPSSNLPPINNLPSINNLLAAVPFSTGNSQEQASVTNSFAIMREEAARLNSLRHVIDREHREVLLKKGHMIREVEQTELIRRQTQKILEDTQLSKNRIESMQAQTQSERDQVRLNLIHTENCRNQAEAHLRGVQSSLPIANLSKSLEGALRDNANLSKSLEAASRDNANLSKSVEAASRDNANLSKSMEAALRDNANLSKSMEAGYAELRALKKDNAELRRIWGSLKKELAQLKSSKVDLMAELEELKSSGVGRADLTEELEAAKSDNAELTKAKADLMKELARLRHFDAGEIMSMEADAERAVAIRGKDIAVKALSKAQNDHAKELDKIKAEALKGLELSGEEIARLEQEVGIKNKQIQTLIAEVDQMHSQNERGKKAISELKVVKSKLSKPSNADSKLPEAQKLFVNVSKDYNNNLLELRRVKLKLRDTERFFGHKINLITEDRDDIVHRNNIESTFKQYEIDKLEMELKERTDEVAKLKAGEVYVQPERAPIRNEDWVQWLKKARALQIGKKSHLIERATGFSKINNTEDIPLDTENNVQNEDISNTENTKKKKEVRFDLSNLPPEALTTEDEERVFSSYEDFVAEITSASKGKKRVPSDPNDSVAEVTSASKGKKRVHFDRDDSVAEVRPSKKSKSSQNVTTDSVNDTNLTAITEVVRSPEPINVDPNSNSNVSHAPNVPKSMPAGVGWRDLAVLPNEETMSIIASPEPQSEDEGGRNVIIPTYERDEFGRMALPARYWPKASSSLFVTPSGSKSVSNKSTSSIANSPILSAVFNPINPGNRQDNPLIINSRENSTNSSIGPRGINSDVNPRSIYSSAIKLKSTTDSDYDELYDISDTESNRKKKK